jgi:hypothetical protein
MERERANTMAATNELGLVGCSWEDTRSSRIRPEFQPATPGDHNALTDALAQAEMFEKMRTAERT